MNERLKSLRLQLELTQEDFGEKIGSARNTIANYESGNRNPSNAVIKAICREYNVDEDWLRNGTGDMFIQYDEDDYSRAAASLSNDDFIKNIMIEYLKLTDDNKKLLRDFIRNVSDNMSEQE